MMLLAKIVSGGQSGVDRGALDAALRLGFPCGGWCPAGRKAEDGPIDVRYPVVELPGAGYRRRTIQNIVDSDATAIIYFGQLEGGTETTVLCCIRRRKPYKLIDAETMPVDAAARLLAEFVDAHSACTLNVAGPRLSKSPQSHEYASALVTRLLQMVIAARKSVETKANANGE